ncbi:hypothetical protein [Anabaena sp. CS-542/02]|uniref:hypothetical protein n=1 Tax=Anabaena sp. CS-542/02 TaxID=3021719 RepID=UPI0023314232|nr:hypothetical protein [Anabaena sp. CS-542/02]
MTKSSHFGRFRFSGLSFSPGRSNNGITPKLIYSTAIWVLEPVPVHKLFPVQSPKPSQNLFKLTL